MTELFISDEHEEQEFEEMGSFNHSIVQSNLVFAFRQLGNYTVPVELSLSTESLDKEQFDFKNELKPDVCLYLERSFVRPYDILKMDEMPLLVVEVLSPRQFTDVLLKKFEAYFSLGVKSCWLVDLVIEGVKVYSSMDDAQSFTSGNVIDKQLEIELPINEIFE